MMGRHVVLDVDRLVVPQAVVSVRSPRVTGSDVGEEKHNVAREEEPLLKKAECRICQEEELVENLETPCACSGSLKYAHRVCVQRWCNEKGDTICEICHESYNPGYTAPSRAHSDEASVNISEAWTITGDPQDLDDPRLLAMAAAQRHFLEAEYDESAATNASGAAFCRSAALILMALLLLRHVLSISGGDEDDDVPTFLSLFLLRLAGFLLPCYIMIWAISILQERRERQEAAAALAAPEVAFLLQSGQRGLQFPIVPQALPTPHQQSHQISSASLQDHV